MSNELRFIKVSVISDEKCSKHAPSNLDYNSTMCAQSETPSQHVRGGDSGSPLFCNIFGGNVIYGVVSLGGNLSVPARVSTAVDWIEKTIKDIQNLKEEPPLCKPIRSV